MPSCIETLRKAHPELKAFLAAKSPELQTELVATLKTEYFHPELESVLKPFQLMAALGYLSHFHILAQHERWEADDNLALRLAASYGHLPILNALLDHVSLTGGYPQWFTNRLGLKTLMQGWFGTNPVQEQVAILDNSALRVAVAHGHLKIMKRLLAYDAVREQIDIEDNDAFCMAACKGHLKVVKYLLTYDKVREQINVDSNLALNLAAFNGHFQVVKHLLTYSKVSDDIDVEDNWVLQDAVRNGHLKIVKYLLTYEKVRDAVATNNNAVLKLAATNGYLKILKHLLTYQDVRSAIAINDHAVLRLAVDHAHLSVVQHLLGYPEVLAYADSNAALYGGYIQFFIEKKMAELREARNRFIHSGARIDVFAPFDVATFDVDAETARLCFYMLRNLIRRNNHSLFDNILFLLDIPSVRALAATAVTPNQPNELFLLAVAVNNQEVITRLQLIPTVRSASLAIRCDLRSLAEDDESSIRGLTVREAQRLNRALRQYEPVVQREGSAAIVDNLRATLRARYEAKPATIQRKKKLIPLPFAWEDFQKLKLNKQAYQAALIAYYQHKDHTAFRYLSKPNPWMDPKAGFILEDGNNRWAYFEEYEDLIAVLWLAVTDSQEPPTEGFTLEGRMEHFIAELALIGRGHNWREIPRPPGTPLDIKLPERDDYSTGDDPSCYSGMKTRFFQGVQGHRLFQVLTQTGIEEELRSFVRAHFQEAITEVNQDILWEAMNRCVVDLTADSGDWQCLKSVDITPEKQGKFLIALYEKYQDEFDDEFLDYLKGRFVLGVENSAHIISFYTEAALEELLISQEAAVQASVAYTPQRDALFEPAESVTNHRPEASQPARVGRCKSCVIL